jgi:aspartyl-tRNA(Asn)/glutamyl-tRNA(Gln) amidotransferase subunit B
MKWEVVIGLEVHVQLSTVSKIFSGASTAFGAEPNTHASAVDLAYPGVLPVLNEAAVERAVRLGLALGSTINLKNVFARKNYFYPDLPKGYQISQMDLPIVEFGTLTIQVGDEEKVVRLTRAHLEEDAGKSLHEDFHGMTGIDLNRAGTPLLEVVSEPDMRSAEEAVAYARTLHTLVTWLGISDGNMQEGSFRVDANVSVRPFGQAEFGTRCEIKNLNSFRFLEAAIKFEVERQVELIEDGGRVVQETRLYDPDRGETRSMRSKEDAHDYRYFPDPDLLPVNIDPALIKLVQSQMPELPAAMKARFIEQFEISVYDASLLTASLEMARYFEALALASGQGKLAANWVVGEIAARLNRDSMSIDACPISPERLAGLIARIVDNTISGKIAKEVFEAMWESSDSADAIIDAKGLKQITDSGAIEAIVDQVLAQNTKSVDEYRAGKEKALNALVGQVMKASKGKANPAQAQEILKQKLAN